MNEVHAILQGKGGVGKSWVAYVMAQYLRSTDPKTVCLDTDPLTPTLVRYKALEPSHIQIADELNVRLDKFDEMMEIIANTQSDVLIDTGSSTFIPISKYMVDYDIVDMIRDSFSKQVVIHVVLFAGNHGDLIATTGCLEAIATGFPESAQIVVWMNEFGGPIKTADGKPFEKSELYNRIKERIRAIIYVPKPDELTARDIAAMQGSFLTFGEAQANPNFMLMQKSRLKKLQKTLFDQIDQASVAWKMN